MHQVTKQGQRSYVLLLWHKFLNISISSFPTAVIPTCLYSLALEVLGSYVVLVRKLWVPPLTLDSTPYGVDRATVALTLSLNTSCSLDCRLRAVHDAFICRPREEMLFHFPKNKPGSACQVWTLHCSSNCGNWSSLVKMTIWCLLRNNFLFITFTTSMKLKWVWDLRLVYTLAGKEL